MPTKNKATNKTDSPYRKLMKMSDPEDRTFFEDEGRGIAYVEITKNKESMVVSSLAHALGVGLLFSVGGASIYDRLHATILVYFKDGTKIRRKVDKRAEAFQEYCRYLKDYDVVGPKIRSFYVPPVNHR